MSEIAYTYEIIKVDADSRIMEVVYTSPGRQSIHMGARLPFQGESLEAVIASYAPTAFWREQEASLMLPEVGQTGSYTPPGVEPTTLGTAKQAKKDELAAWRYLKETQGITLGGTLVRTDRESQAQLTSAYVSLKNGLGESVRWKDATGTWVPMTLAEIEPVAAAVFSYVQSCFSHEETLSNLVDAASTVDEVKAIEVPWGS